VFFRADDRPAATEPSMSRAVAPRDHEGRAAVIEEVSSAFEGAQQDRLDGLTVDLGDWWFNLRPSNTEPLLRLNLEARDAAACDEHTAEVLALVGDVDGRGHQESGREVPLAELHGRLEHARDGRYHRAHAQDLLDGRVQVLETGEVVGGERAIVHHLTQIVHQHAAFHRHRQHLTTHDKSNGSKNESVQVCLARPAARVWSVPYACQFWHVWLMVG